MQKKFTCRLFVLIILGNTWVCTANDILLGCQCNIANACDPQGKPRDNWAQYLPQGVGRFGYAVGSKQNLAYVCEGHAVATLFDCNSKIPLYSATVMTGEQLSAGSSDRPSYFRKSQQVQADYQQEQLDYDRSSERSLCYKMRSKTTLVVDHKWAKARNLEDVVNFWFKDGVCIIPELLKTEIHKGHLVAANYGRGNEERILATFTYTNVVPQFGRFNSGPWQRCETKLVKWGKNNCAFKGAQNVQMFIVVGAVPSTVTSVFRDSQPRWFGKEGFSNYKNKDDYPVNLPKHLWTAACCVYQYYDEGKLIQGTKNTAFERINDPGNSQCNTRNMPSLTNLLSINPFPNSPQCNTLDNYIAL